MPAEKKPQEVKSNIWFSKPVARYDGYPCAGSAIINLLKKKEDNHERDKNTGDRVSQVQKIG
jgi:hypothetical protein